MNLKEFAKTTADKIARDAFLREGSSAETLLAAFQKVQQMTETRFKPENLRVQLAGVAEAETHFRRWQLTNLKTIVPGTEFMECYRFLHESARAAILQPISEAEISMAEKTIWESAPEGYDERSVRVGVEMGMKLAESLLIGAMKQARINK